VEACRATRTFELKHVLANDAADYVCNAANVTPLPCSNAIERQWFMIEMKPLASEKDIVVVVDPRAKTVTVTATPAEMEVVNQIITAMDRQPDAQKSHLTYDRIDGGIAPREGTPEPETAQPTFTY